MCACAGANAEPSRAAQSDIIIMMGVTQPSHARARLLLVCAGGACALGLLRRQLSLQLVLIQQHQREGERHAVEGMRQGERERVLRCSAGGHV